MTLHPNTTLQGGRYRILSVLGQGGFGITYLAEQTLLDGKVAIKEFFMKELCERDESTSRVTLGTSSNREMVEKCKQKFLKEARTIFKLNHPNIVRILDVFEENGTAYYVMDYIEGESLADMVKRRGALPEAEAVNYVKEVGKALTYIHERKLNHLDIKPSNIMRREEDGRIMLIDFGVSKQYDLVTSEGTSTTPVGISRGYSPAEQYRQHGVQTFSPQSDVYALAATLYKLLTGVTPPEAMEVLDGGLPVTDLQARHISTHVIASIQRAMKGKSERTQSVAAFLNALGNSKEEDKDEETEVIGVVTPKTKPKFPVKIVLGFAVVLFAVIFVEFCSYRQVDHEAIYNKSGKVIYYWTGKMRGNNPTGIGIINYLQDDSEGRLEYKGNMTNGLRKSLSATLSYRNGNHYSGSFSNDEFVKGKLTLQEDSIFYEGTFENDKPYNGAWYFLSDSSLFSTVTYGVAEKQLITVNGVRFTMVHVQGGKFYMGKRNISDDNELYPPQPTDIDPWITLSSFSIGETEVTQELWEAVMGSNPSNYKGAKLPVEQVSWDDCQEFIRKLNAATGETFRLPTEAEWEYAARGGNKSRNYKYAGSNSLGDVAWYKDNSGSTTHNVATKQSNELGLYDMSGNVLEWCSDWYGDYIRGNQTNPKGPSSGSSRVSRGGSWYFSAWYCRSSHRFNDVPGYRDDNLGFRLALSE